MTSWKALHVYICNTLRIIIGRYQITSSSYVWYSTWIQGVGVNKVIIGKWLHTINDRQRIMFQFNDISYKEKTKKISDKDSFIDRWNKNDLFQDGTNRVRMLDALNNVITWEVYEKYRTQLATNINITHEGKYDVCRRKIVNRVIHHNLTWNYFLLLIYTLFLTNTCLLLHECCPLDQVIIPPSWTTQILKIRNKY